MHDTLNRCVRPVAAALAVLFGTVVLAPPLAAETAAAAPRPLSIRSAAVARVAALEAGTQVAAQQAAAPATESTSFFKSRKGVIALLLFAAGTTFTFVSKSKDRVKSPIRN